ncbi:MAG: prepilin peptidase [Planctomycetales bacterium]|nr:prepilin peptidase [Planctomycetales bacterium]
MTFRRGRIETFYSPTLRISPNRLPLIDFITALWFGFLGACVGSFLNVVAYRMPRGLSVVWQPSHCPNCKRPIRPYDNVPVLGWLWLRGRCRDCRAPISPRYAIVETVVGAVFFLLAYVEIFTGGANLPGGPLTELPGAWHTVWNPFWPLLATYGQHALLMALLTAIVLFALDEVRAPRALLAAAFVLIAVAAVGFPAAWRPAATLPGGAPVSGVLMTAIDIGLGALPGLLLAFACRADGRASKRFASKKRRRKQPAKRSSVELSNAGMALALVGAALGLRALPTVAALTAAAAAGLHLATRRQPKRPGLATAAIWIAALGQLIIWRQLAALTGLPS